MLIFLHHHWQYFVPIVSISYWICFLNYLLVYCLCYWTLLHSVFCTHLLLFGMLVELFVALSYFLLSIDQTGFLLNEAFKSKYDYKIEIIESKQIENYSFQIGMVPSLLGFFAFPAPIFRLHIAPKVVLDLLPIFLRVQNHLHPI